MHKQGSQKNKAPALFITAKTEGKLMFHFPAR